MKSSASKIELTAYDDLFETDESRIDLKREKVMEIPLAEIDVFPNHPFRVRVDEAMNDMVESIRKVGVLTPAIVRQKEDGRYELISGHRRRMACELAGIDKMPALVKTLSLDEAIILMVDSNLQREELLPSEKAFSYKMRLEAMKRQAGRPNKDNYSPSGNNYKTKTSSEEMSTIIGESKNQVFRFIRLTELVPDVLDMVDEKSIAFQPAVEISYLTPVEQRMLYETMDSENCTPSLSQAQRMKKLSQDGRLNEDVIFTIMTEEKPNQKEKIVLKDERFNRYFPSSFTAQQKEELLAKLLENWWHKQRQQER
ncbi:MAG: ParB/RepB/Spo0J family partition protein [Saccharofermentanales bacterium]